MKDIQHLIEQLSEDYKWNQDRFDELKKSDKKNRNRNSSASISDYKETMYRILKEITTLQNALELMKSYEYYL